MAGRPGAGEPEAPGSQAVAQQLLHLGHLVGRGLAFGGGGTHYHPTQRRVADQEPGVRHQRAVEPIEEAARGGPVPRQADLQALERHTLHPGEHAHEVVGVVGPHGGIGGECQRGDGEAAVATDDGGDTVQRRRAEGGVPERLRVVVRVQVDEAGRHHQATRIDLVDRGLGEVADGDDATVADTDIGHPTGRTRAVDDRSPGDLQIEHVRTVSAGCAAVFSRRRPGRGRRCSSAAGRRRWPRRCLPTACPTCPPRRCPARH